MQAEQQALARLLDLNPCGRRGDAIDLGVWGKSDTVARDIAADLKPTTNGYSLSADEYVIATSWYASKERSSIAILDGWIVHYGRACSASNLGSVAYNTNGG